MAFLWGRGLVGIKAGLRKLQGSHMVSCGFQGRFTGSQGVKVF